LRALQRLGSCGGLPRPRDDDDRSFFEDLRRFCSDAAMSDVAEALSRDECRVLVLFTDDERVTAAAIHDAQSAFWF